MRWNESQEKGHLKSPEQNLDMTQQSASEDNKGDLAGKPKTGKEQGFKFKKAMIACAGVGLLALVAIIVVVAGNSTKNVKDVTYTLSTGYTGIYTGEWKGGNPNGYGTFILDDGVYEGEWKDGEFDGQGTFTWTSGSSYVGGYKNGIFSGQGTYTWSSGDVYEGEFQDGLFNGQGTLTWTIGEVYEGEWEDDKRNGQGTLTYADGTVKTGTWKDDEFVE